MIRGCMEDNARRRSAKAAGPIISAADMARDNENQGSPSPRAGGDGDVDAGARLPLIRSPRSGRFAKFRVWIVHRAGADVRPTGSDASQNCEPPRNNLRIGRNLGPVLETVNTSNDTNPRAWRLISSLAQLLWQFGKERGGQMPGDPTMTLRQKSNMAVEERHETSVHRMFCVGHPFPSPSDGVTPTGREPSPGRGDTDNETLGFAFIGVDRGMRLATKFPAPRYEQNFTHNWGHRPTHYVAWEFQPLRPCSIHGSVKKPNHGFRSITRNLDSSGVQFTEGKNSSLAPGIIFDQSEGAVFMNRNEI